MADLLWSLTGALFGGLLSLMFTWLFYRKSSEELREEASKLRELNFLMLRGLEEAGGVEFTRDEEGNLVGIRIRVSASSHGSSTLTAHPSVREPSKQNEDEASAE